MVRTTLPARNVNRELADTRVPADALAEGLTAFQTARSSMRFGQTVQLDAEVVITPLGLLAIGALVSGILLSIPPIVRAATRN